MLIVRCTIKCLLYRKSEVCCNSEVNCMKENLTLAKCLWSKLLCSHKVKFGKTWCSRNVSYRRSKKNPSALPHPNAKETAEHHWIKTT